MANKQQGFTLIEIMIVVTIITIIGAFAYPTYAEHMRKTQRVEAKIGLQDIARLQESYFTRNYSYANQLSMLGSNYADTQPTPEGMYTLTIGQVTPSGCNGTQANACKGFVASASPMSSGPQTKDETCASFTLDNMGRKGALDKSSNNTTQTCW